MQTIDKFLIWAILSFYSYRMGLGLIFLLIAAIFLLWSFFKGARLAIYSLAIVPAILLSFISEPHLNIYKADGATFEAEIRWIGSRRERSGENGIFKVISGPYKNKIFISDNRTSPSGSLEFAKIKIRAFDRPAFNNRFNEENYMEKQGFSGRAQVKVKKVIHKVYGQDFKTRVLEGLKASFDRIPGQAGLFLKRIVLGSSAVGDYSMKDTIKDLGLSHLLAASGLHVGMIFSWAIFILSFFPIKRALADLIIFSFLSFYAYILDFPPSICRAVFFMLFKEIAILFKGRGTNRRAFLLSLFLYLVFRPYAALDYGLLLSYGSSLAIALIGSLERRRHSNSQIIKSIRASIAINIINLPIMASMGASLNSAVILGNMLAIPAFSGLFALGLFAYIFAFLPLLGGLIVKLYMLAYFFFSALIESLAALGLPKFDPVRYLDFLAQYVFMAGLILVYIFNKMRIIRFDKGVFGQISGRALYEVKKKALIFTVLVVIILPGLDKVSKNLFIGLDVGQGDGLLFKSQKANIMFDTGGRFLDKKEKNGDGVMLCSKLRSYGVNRIDAVFISHPDYDHMGNLDKLLDHMRVLRVFTSPMSDGSFPKDIQNMVRKSKKSSGARCIAMKADTQYLFSNNPDRDNKTADENRIIVRVVRKGQYDAENKNGGSAVVLLKYGPRILLTGDYEPDIDAKKFGRGIDLLKLAHHGSKNGSSENMLKSWQPKQTLISSGRNNRYGHPAKSVIKRLKKLKLPYRITAYEGDIIYSYKGGKLKAYSKKEVDLMQVTSYIEACIWALFVIAIVDRLKKSGDQKSLSLAVR